MVDTTNSMTFEYLYNFCLKISTLTTQGDYTNFQGRINDTANIYVGIGFASLVANYLFHVMWNTACERQIKRMRLIFDFLTIKLKMK